VNTVKHVKENIQHSIIKWYRTVLKRQRQADPKGKASQDYTKTLSQKADKKSSWDSSI
jgi:hypothetical protein